LVINELIVPAFNYYIVILYMCISEMHKTDHVGSCIFCKAALKWCVLWKAPYK